MLRALRLAVALAVSPFVLVAGAFAQAPPELSNPQIDIEYVQPRNSALQPIRERLQKRLVLEQLKQFLAPLRLPQKLAVHFDQCGGPARAYKSPGPSSICYELIDQIEKI